MIDARRCTRSAMRRNPTGPWYTAYIDAMTDNSTCAVQMLDVAFSRRMCCSRVCRANRYAVRPWLSTETPTRRPGSERLNASRVAMKAACGPPKPMGTPNLCVEPITQSAPALPGDCSNTRASTSAATATSAPASWARCTIGSSGSTVPSVPGYCTKMPYTPSRGSVAGSATTTSMPSGSARTRTTAIVCG